MLGFRKKILLFDILLVVLILACLVPLAGLTVHQIVQRSLSQRAKVLITHLQRTSNTEELIAFIEKSPEFALQPLSLLDATGTSLYSSLPIEMQATDLEIQAALQKGQGFAERSIADGGGPVYCVATRFTLQGKTYILDLLFQGSEINQLKFDFELAIVGLTILLLIVSGIFHTFVVQKITSPIQQVIDCIRPYKEGKEELLPKIVLKKEMQGGEFSKLVHILNSLTERIQSQIDRLTRQQNETREILESINEGIIAVDASAKVTFANQVAYQMLAVEQASLVGLPLNATKSASTELVQKCHELLLHALQLSEPNMHTWAQKGPLYFHLIAAPLTHQHGALLVLQDKTSDFKMVEMGKDFIANASHELRTPITIIRGFAETLQDLPDLSQAMLKEITDKIVKTCGRLDKLVRSLLTLADIENLSEERLQPVDLQVIVENCKHLFLAAHPDVQLHIRSSMTRVPILADADLIELAILNLLENALRYSQPPAKIDIEMRQENGEIQLCVQDQGIGIAEADLPRIFDRFYTVDKARSRKSGGTGLGLSIVKTIIEKHRGHVSVASQLHKGSTFILAFPSKADALLVR